VEGQKSLVCWGVHSRISVAIELSRWYTHSDDGRGRGRKGIVIE